MIRVDLPTRGDLARAFAELARVLRPHPLDVDVVKVGHDDGCMALASRRSEDCTCEIVEVVLPESYREAVEARIRR